MKQGLLTILKFLLFLFILPLIIACVLAFQGQVLAVPVNKEVYLLWGVALYIVLHLFLYNFKAVYLAGRSLVAKLFPFLGPSADTLGAIVPIYAILIICVGLVLNVLGYGVTYGHFVIFALGFTGAMHIIGTAQHMYEADPSPLKSHYLVFFGLILIACLIVLAAVLVPLVPEFSFINFIKSMANHTVVYYKFIYKALFVAP